MKRLVFLLLVTACGGGTQLPKGPPPQYEDEPGMSQADAATSPQTPAPTADAGAGG